MATNDLQEISVLKEQNNELVQKVQYWKVLAGQREKEKLDLMKDLGEMRLKLSRLRSNGNVQASKLDVALQSASKNALDHLVRASNEIARSIDVAQAYMRARTELEAESPRWSTVTVSNVKSEKVHRVPPMMIGGQSIQPVVSLSRTLLNTNNTGPSARSPNQGSGARPLPLPMHMLQDVYIPLTRIDAGEPSQPMDTEPESADDTLEEARLDNSSERDPEESQRMSHDEDYNSSRMETVTEDLEPEDGEESPQRPVSPENPLEGPSCLLDAPSSSSKQSGALSLTPLGRGTLEPDSTTELEDLTPARLLHAAGSALQSSKPCSVRLSNDFTPTVRVRRRKRTSSPPPLATPSRASQYSPRPSHSRRTSPSGRVLKVMVAKMRLESLSPGSPAPKRPASRAALDPHDAPSPNGATVPGVIVSSDLGEEGGAGEPHVTRRPSLARRRARRSLHSPDGRVLHTDSDAHEHTRHQDSRAGSCDSRSSDSVDGEGRDTRSRRPRKIVSYQEKPLNRKLRR